MARKMSEGREIVIGLGTGRCGSHALAALLNAQRGAAVRHEMRPLLPWRRASSDASRARVARIFRELHGSLVGDVCSSYLPYAQDCLSDHPRLKLVCLKREKEAVVKSFCAWLDKVHPFF